MAVVVQNEINNNKQTLVAKNMLRIIRSHRLFDHLSFDCEIRLRLFSSQLH